MKSKKKLLLMGVGVMGALAMGVGATSTFAWYSVAVGGKIQTKASDDNVLTAADPTYSVEKISLPVTIAITRVDAGTPTLELAHYYSTKPSVAGDIKTVDGTGAGLYSGYIDQSNGIHLKQGVTKASGTVIQATYKVTIGVGAAGTYGNVEWTQDQIATALGDRTAKVTVSAAKYVAGDASAVATTTYYQYDSGTNTYAVADPQPAAATDASGLYKIQKDTTNGNIRFMNHNDVQATAESAAEVDGTKELAMEFSLSGITKSAGIDHYFTIYVEGDRGTTADSKNVHAPFVAQVEDANPLA